MTLLKCFISITTASTLLLATTLTMAQPPAPVDPGQKSITIVRTDSPPVIDGVLDDAAWENAAFFDDFHQVNPAEYTEPSERTEIYLLYDDEALYVGARMFIDPDQITANVMRQNGNMLGDDTIFLTLDPFNNQRGGVFFGINPHAVRRDGLYRNVSEFYSDWDTIFYAETSFFEGGWTAEYEIPFRSLSFDPDSDTWGLNITRTIQNRAEDMAWMSRNRRWDPSSSGRVTGFQGLQQGVGLDIIPSMSLNNERRYSPESSEFSTNPSLDMIYKITPSLNGSLTFNTDFSATEVDDRQVNLTRFNLFFPEKRDFFLREADIFEFGRIGAQGSTGGGADSQNGRPFFSRTIGLGNTGQIVDLDYGAKVSGRIGNWEVGALSIRQSDYASIAAETLSVVRAKAGIGGESTLGVIFTEGDPHSNLDNSLGGVDYLYRNSRLSGGRVMEVSGWYQQSDTQGLEGDDSAGGISFSMPSNAGLRYSAAVKKVEKNFNPGQGFVSRLGVQDMSAAIGYTHRPDSGPLQSIFFGMDAQRIEEIDGGLQSQQFSVTPFNMTSNTGNVIFMRSNFSKEVLNVPFQIYPGVVIPAGEYSFDNHGIEIQGADFRKVSGRMAYLEGSFYSGDQARLFGNVTWSPSPKFRTNVGFNITDVELPEGDFTTRLLTAGLDYVFSSTLSWVNLIQYDNVSETAGINMRLHWIPEIGKELFFVINHTLEDYDRDNRFDSVFSDVAVKFSYTFRY